MLGIGIDIARISRFEKPKQTFIEKVLHSNEILEYEKSKNKPKFLAERWAIKEALFKANNDFFHFNKIELKVVERIFRFPGYIITTSTEDDYYIAFVQREK